MASGRSTLTTSHPSSDDGRRDGPSDEPPGPSGREALSIALGILVLVLLATLLIDPNLITVNTGSPSELPVAVSVWFLGRGDGGGAVS